MAMTFTICVPGRTEIEDGKQELEKEERYWSAWNIRLWPGDGCHLLSFDDEKQHVQRWFGTKWWTCTRSHSALLRI
jgi:hypothetical protein